MNRRDPRVFGLYAITPDEADTDRLVALVAAALEGGANLVQYRNKSADASLRADQAMRLAKLCSEHRRPLIINDHVELAMTIANAGLHVGIDDADDLPALRARLGDSRILGISCYASLDRAKLAQDGGANYVAFGSVFPSSTKPAAIRAPLNLFAQARGLHIATVGIGGIEASNLPCLIEAGADAAAVIADLFDGSGCANELESERAAIRARAAALSRCFARCHVHACEEEPWVTRPDSCSQGFRS